MISSGYRFPYNLTRHWLRPSTYRWQIQHWIERARFGVSYHDEFGLDFYLTRVLLHSLPKYKNVGSYGRHVEFVLPNAGFNATQDERDEWDEMIESILARLKELYDDEMPAIRKDLSGLFADLGTVYQCLWW